MTLTTMFRVLGQVSVQHGTHEIAVGPAKQRAVLGALLLDANRVVGVSSLISAVWDGEPPVSAVANIRTYVSQLRAALPRSGTDCRLATTSSGYAIRVIDEEFDLPLFRRHADAGRAALATGDALAAVAELRAALSLWNRGSAYGDFGSMTLLRRFDALDEQRLAVVERLVDARQELGEDAELVDELRDLTQRHPTRERLWAHMMLSLYRCGDVRGALAAWSQARDAVVGELGVDPGPELRDLHRRILDRDVTLGISPTPLLRPNSSPMLGVPPSAAAQAMARELPPDVRTLFRGEAEVASILEATSPLAADVGHSRVAILFGPKGAGKSTLAIHAAHRQIVRCPDGQLYADFAGVTGESAATEVLARFVRALGHPRDEMPATDEELRACYRSLVAARRLVIVLDNVTDAEQVVPLLPGAPGSLVIVTSGSVLPTLDATARFHVSPLADHDVHRVLRQVAERQKLSIDEGSLRRIASACRGLPAATHIATVCLQGRPRWTSTCADEVIDALNGGALHLTLAHDAALYGGVRARRSPDGNGAADVPVVYV